MNMAMTAASGRFTSLSSGSKLDVTHRAFGATGDGVTNDTAAIQAAITAASAAGGAVVYLPGGTYVISTYLTIPSNVWLRGAGKTSVIKRADFKDGTGSMHLMISDTAATKIIISDLDIDGNGHNQVIELPIVTNYNANQCNIRLVQATDCIIERVCSHDPVNACIYLEDCVGCIVTKNVCYGGVGTPGGNFGDGAILHYGHNNVISNNVSHNHFNDGICSSEGDTITISGNVCFNNGGNGIELYGASAVNLCRNSTVIGNTCYDNAYRGIFAAGTNQAYVLGGSIVGNTIWQNGWEGIYVLATRFTIAGNQISQSDRSGIRGDHLTDCVIADNIISENNIDSTAGFSGIYLTGNAPRNMIHGNSITNGVGGHQFYAINLSAATVTNTTIGLNSLVDGGVTAPINDAGSNTIIASRHSLRITPSHLHRSNANLGVAASAAYGAYAYDLTTANQTMFFDVPIVREDNTTRHYVESLTIYYETLTAGTEKIDTYALYERNMSTGGIGTVLSGAGAPPGAAGRHTIVNTPASPEMCDYSTEHQLFLEIVLAGEGAAGRLYIFGAVLVYHDMTTMYHHD